MASVRIGAAGIKILIGASAVCFMVSSISCQPCCAEGPLGSVIEMNNKGQYREALDLAQSLLVTMPNDERIHFNLGRAYEGLNRMSEAVEQYQACQKLAPSSAVGVGSKEAIERICTKYPRLRSVFKVDDSGARNSQVRNTVQNYQSLQNRSNGQSTSTSLGSSSAGAASSQQYVKNYVNYGAGLPVQSIPDEPAMRARALGLSAGPAGLSGASKSSKGGSHARSSK